MKKSENVFQRYEKKYVLTYDQYHQFLDRIKDKMVLDEYGRHTIMNIYYDTDEYALIQTSLEKPFYKEKIRLRSYGIPNEDSRAYLELKKKVNGIVFKRRVGVSYQNAVLYMDHCPCKIHGQIMQEIDYFTHEYDLSPKMMIAYDRMAYMHEQDSDLRITFDFNIRYRLDDLDLCHGDQGRVLDGDIVVLEIKIAYAMPMWLSSLLSQLEIYPASFSKYGRCYRQVMEENICSVQSYNQRSH